MSNLQKIIDIAKAQVGVSEQPPGSNNVIYNTDYYGGVVQGTNFPWCCSFIWWLFHQTGLSALFCGGQKTAFCPFVVQYAREHRQWVTDGYRAGDLLLYDWDGDGQADHIGLCESVSGLTATTIEGNVTDSVKRMTRSLVSVMGAYRPAYGEDNNVTAKPTPAPVQDAPKEGGTYTVKAGDSLWSIAERAYGNGNAYPLLISANHLTGATIHVGDVLKIPSINGDAPKTCSVSLPVLQRGDNSVAVRNLQAMLAVRGYQLDADGDFGGVTYDRVVAFQHSCGIPANGIVDSKTWEKFFQ